MYLGFPFELVYLPYFLNGNPEKSWRSIWKVTELLLPFCLHFGIKYSKPDINWEDITNKSIMKKQQTHKWKRQREERRLKIILCVSTQKQLERRIQASLNAVCAVGMICIIAKCAILILNCRIFGNLAHLFICWFT